MQQKTQGSAKLFSDFNNLQFAGVLGMVLFVLLLLFITDAFTPSGDFGVSVDLAKVSHPISMRGAAQEDAIQVSVTRDGQLFFGSDKITADSLPDRIRERLKDRDVERKVYIKADMRARWGGLKQGP